MQKVVVNCARRTACFKKAAGYIGGRVTTGSVTHIERPSAEQPDTAQLYHKGQAGLFRQVVAKRWESYLRYKILVLQVGSWVRA